MMDLDAFKAFNDTRGHPAGDALLAEIARAMSAALRDGDRLYRYGGDEFAAILPGRRPGRGPRGRRAAPAQPWPTLAGGRGPHGHDQRRRRLLPRRRPDEGRAGRGRRPGDVPGQAGGPRPPTAARRRDDPYLRALDETALALLDRRDSDDPARDDPRPAPARCSGRRTATSTSSSPTARSWTSATAPGCSRQGVGHRQPVDEGIGGEVFLTGRPVAIDDYDAYVRRAGIVPTRHARRGRRRARSRSGDEVVGVIGLASGATDATVRRRARSTR